MDIPSNSRNINKRGIKSDGQVSRGAKRRCFKKDQLKEDVRHEFSLSFIQRKCSGINSCLANA